MKKLLLTLLISMSIQSAYSSGFHMETDEALTLTSYVSLNMTLSGLLDKEQAAALDEDINIYELNGEIRPELAAQIEALISQPGNEDLSELEAIEIIAKSIEGNK